jgi:hypothetical protein
MTQNGDKKGIIIAVPKKYEKLCLLNVQKIRALNCLLPIEIWEVGNEISKEIRCEFEKIKNLRFQNVLDYCNNDIHWKGFQIKAFILFYTQFKEVLLCDSDVILYQNPILLFEDEMYIKTGAYFFKDLEKWQFKKLDNKWEQFRQRIFYNKFKSLSFFLKRKHWLKTLLPEMKSTFPKEWEYIYSNHIPREPVKEALQESGVVLMNKDKHKKSIQFIYDLNNNHEETYKYIWGDKETFWIGCVMADKDYFFNPTSGYVSKDTGRLTHDYNGKIFFSQKG